MLTDFRLINSMVEKQIACNGKYKYINKILTLVKACDFVLYVVGIVWTFGTLEP